VARRQTRRCFCVLRGRYQRRGTAPVLFERRQFGERAHPYGHVHRQHRADPRHGWRPAGQGSGRDCAGGLHHSKQWRLDHVRQIPELTACDTGHRLAAITLRHGPKMAGERGLRSANQFVNGPSPERAATTRMRRSRASAEIRLQPKSAFGAAKSMKASSFSGSSSPEIDNVDGQQQASPPHPLPRQEPYSPRSP
jgi:hypothetical protein